MNDDSVILYLNEYIKQQEDNNTYDEDVAHEAYLDELSYAMNDSDHIIDALTLNAIDYPDCCSNAASKEQFESFLIKRISHALMSEDYMLAGMLIAPHFKKYMKRAARSQL